MDDRPILVLGATGYVGGRLVPMLLDRGHNIRAASRSVDKIKARTWGNHPNLEAVAVDMMDVDSLADAVQGCSTTYYLVHSMTRPARDFAELERLHAYNMVEAAKYGNLERIIYLGGLGEDEENQPLSKHLRSRTEVARILSLAPSKVTFLRAAMILGSGSASFELLRYMVERIPLFVAPKWVRTLAQPIGIKDALRYLVGCLENPKTAGLKLDIGGPDIVSYQDLIDIYAEEAGLKKRPVIPVPFVTPKLSSYWLNLMTPVPMPLINHLVEGLRNEVVCRETAIRELVPGEPISCRLAIRRALDQTVQASVDTTCYDSGDSTIPAWANVYDADYAGGTIYDFTYSMRLQGTRSKVWDALERIGGVNGWYSGDILWRIRGFMDSMIAGPGIRGRRNDERTRQGDALDFWRVLDLQEEQRLLLGAEMRLPGEALLEFRILPHWENVIELVMSARFRPRGVSGILYWRLMYPFHAVLFANMMENITQAAECFIVEKPHRIPTTYFCDL